MQQRFGFCTSTILALPTHHCDFCLDFFFLWIFFKVKFWVTYEVCWSGSMSCAENDQCKFMEQYLDSLIFTCNAWSILSGYQSSRAWQQKISNPYVYSRNGNFGTYSLGHGNGHPNIKGLFFRSLYFKNFTLSILITFSKGIYFTLRAFSIISQHQVHKIFIKEQTSEEGS